jgi:hypothetical protein
MSIFDGGGPALEPRRGDFATWVVFSDACGRRHDRPLSGRFAGD